MLAIESRKRYHNTTISAIESIAILSTDGMNIIKLLSWVAAPFQTLLSVIYAD
jgi:hypothetical protein